MIKINPVRNRASLKSALARIDELMDARPNTPEGDELDILTTLVYAYEERCFPVEAPDAVTAIRFVMEQQGYDQRDLAALFGESRASEVLNRKRPLSMKQAQTLKREWRVPAEALLAE